jgi:hypothetical protein
MRRTGPECLNSQARITGTSAALCRKALLGDSRHLCYNPLSRNRARPATSAKEKEPLVSQGLVPFLPTILWSTIAFSGWLNLLIVHFVPILPGHTVGRPTRHVTGKIPSSRRGMACSPSRSSCAPDYVNGPSTQWVSSSHTENQRGKAACRLPPRQERAHRPRRPLWPGPLPAHLLRPAARLPAGRAEPNPRTAGRVAGLTCPGRAREHHAAEIEHGLGGVWRADGARSSNLSRLPAGSLAGKRSEPVPTPPATDHNASYRTGPLTRHPSPHGP